jgi:hypothetical protein
MRATVTFRDWTYVTLVAVALVTYAASLATKALAAHDTGVHVCAYSAGSPVSVN